MIASSFVRDSAAKLADIETFSSSNASNMSAPFFSTMKFMELFDAKFGCFFSCDDPTRQDYGARKCAWSLAASASRVNGVVEEVSNTSGTSQMPDSLFDALLSGRLARMKASDNCPALKLAVQPSYSECLFVPLAFRQNLQAVLCLFDPLATLERDEETLIRPLIIASCLSLASFDTGSKSRRGSANISLGIDDGDAELKVLTDSAPVGILRLDREWRCVYANDAWREYCQMIPEELRGTGWLEGVHSADVDALLDSLNQCVSEGREFSKEFRLQSDAGKIVWVKGGIRILCGDDGRISGILIAAIDISEQIQNQHVLKEITKTDQLTGLINRAFFVDRVGMAIKSIPKFGSAALMVIDLDEFKHINETLGHSAGDQILKEMADRLRMRLSEVDTIARVGGDEFTVLISNVVNDSSIVNVAKNLIEALKPAFNVGSRRIYLTCSIGIAIAEDVETTPESLLKQANRAVHKAKDSGKNQFRFYTRALDKKADLQLLLSQSLKEEGRNDFRVVYQPQVDASSGEIVGAEALARWTHSDTGVIPPDTFIKMLEESGLMSEFFSWLLEDVLRSMNQWASASKYPLGIRISINLSAKQFRDRDLAEFICRRCNAYGVSPHLIVFEITETALIDDPSLAADTLRKLRKMGFGLALDDFGTGYSSLANLRDMPLECVKIDRSFIADILKDDEDTKIVSTILMLAATLGLEVVAEGVEEVAVVNWLLDRCCSIQQGYYFHRPLERADFETLMSFAPSITERPGFSDINWANSLVNPGRPSA